MERVKSNFKESCIFIHDHQKLQQVITKKERSIRQKINGFVNVLGKS